MKRNFFRMRKSILMLVIFVLVAGFICKQVLNVSFASVIELCD
ncbi:putative membrane protein [Escherichia coli UMNF18]|nr:putative membrane protein [Escherichia coli UMNF18]EKI45095.1 putative membrane protein [Escherichia coli N1]KDY19024.1 putative membrane protein [Escherichia coli 2-316-03_S4_C2]